jgi:hypothetical protein
VFEPLAPVGISETKGATYERGLLLVGRRKSMQRMAESPRRRSSGLQQFVSSSTCAVEPVRKWLAALVVAVIAPGPGVLATEDVAVPRVSAL